MSEANEDCSPAPCSAPLPSEPPEGLLHSMAIRYDHGLAVPGYYDHSPLYVGPSHKERYEATITTMRQLYEEVSGHGFFSWPKQLNSWKMSTYHEHLKPKT